MLASAAGAAMMTAPKSIKLDTIYCVIFIMKTAREIGIFQIVISMNGQEN